MLVNPAVVVPAELVNGEHRVRIAFVVHAYQDVRRLVDARRRVQKPLVCYTNGTHAAPALTGLPVSACDEGLALEFRKAHVEVDDLL